MGRELFRLDEISIRGLCMELLGKLWMILMAGVSMFFLATGWHNLTYQPEYTSSSTLVVSLKGEGDTYSSLSLATQMADVFSQVFSSDALRERISEDTGEDISGQITCSPVTETNLMTLSATSESPREAYLYLISALRNYENVAGDVFANSSLQMVQEPQVPTEPSNTSWVISHRALLVLLAMAAMVGVIILFYLFRFTVKTPAGGERQLDGKVRGIIPFEKKRGRRSEGKQCILLTSPLVSMGFAESSRRAEARVEYHLRKKKVKVLLVTSMMENEGKSTVAANLALAMAEKHRKVLLIDGDLLKPAMHKIFEEEKGDRAALSDVLTGKVDPLDALWYSEKHRICELFQFKGVKDTAKLLDIGRLSALLESWKRQMDYVIVDCSPMAVSTDAEVWINVVDSVLLVVREDGADVRMINDTVDMIWQSGKDFSGFILNAFHREWFRASGGGSYGGYGYGGYGYDGYHTDRGKTLEKNG